MMTKEEEWESIKQVALEKLCSGMKFPSLKAAARKWRREQRSVALRAMG